MSKVKPDNNTVESLPNFDFGLHSLSKEVPTDSKTQEEIQEEKSLSMMSRHVGITDYFSSSLKQQVQVSNHGIIPSIMFLCIEQLQMRGLKEEGLFRIPGTHSKIQATRKLLEERKKVDFDNLDINTVASILKLWLRELPTPLIPFCEYPKLIALGGTLKQLTTDEKLDWMGNLKKVICSIQSPEFDCLRHLMVFLSQVGKNSAVNKMDSRNLAIVMVPNILYRKIEEDEAKNAFAILQSSRETGSAIEIVTALIQEVKFFFAEDDHVYRRSEIKKEEKTD